MGGCREKCENGREKKYNGLPFLALNVADAVVQHAPLQLLTFLKQGMINESLSVTHLFVERLVTLIYTRFATQVLSSLTTLFLAAVDCQTPAVALFRTDPSFLAHPPCWHITLPLCCPPTQPSVSTDWMLEPAKARLAGSCNVPLLLFHVPFYPCDKLLSLICFLYSNTEIIHDHFDCIQEGYDGKLSGVI